MDDEYITISDDEDCQVIEHIVNLEPTIIDLTKTERKQQKFEPIPAEPGPLPSPPPSASSSSPPAPPTPPTPPPPTPPTPPSPQTKPQPQPPTPSSSSTPPPPPTTKTTTTAPPPPPPTTTAAAPPQATPTPAPPPATPNQPSPFTRHESQPKQPQQTTKPTPPPPSAPRPQDAQQPKKQKPQMSDHELMVAQKTLGNEKYRHNLFDDAIRTYKRANELAKKLGNKEMSAILHFNLAMTYYKLGSFDQAADECANAVKINDKYIKAHLKRAEIYQRQAKFEEAVICYEHICELDSTNQDYAILLNHAKEAAKHTKKKDYFQLLGLNCNTFTREDLKKAYRQSALNHHPDRHSDADIVTRRIEEKRFKEASEAHSFIQLRYGYRR